MTPEAQSALNFLATLTPTNIHLKTDATLSTRMDFEALWNNHGPQAARYGILVQYMEGDLAQL